jgi:hypothetical protein
MIPTPVQQGAVYRLLGAVTFTIIEVAPGVLEMAVRNLLTRAITVNLLYDEGGTHGSSNGVVAPRSSRTLEVNPPNDFAGTYEITANQNS